jgi:hypothetical protein
MAYRMIYYGILYTSGTCGNRTFSVYICSNTVLLNFEGRSYPGGCGTLEQLQYMSLLAAATLPP